MGGCGGLCTVVVPPVNSHGCQWNIKLICGLCDSPRGGGLAVSLQFCPSISILILNQCGLKTNPLNWCFILNSQCSSCSASRHCETDVFSAVTNCCVYIFIVLAYDGPRSVFFAEGSRRVTWMCIKRVLCRFCCSELYLIVLQFTPPPFFFFFYPIWLNLADSHHTLPIRPRFMSVSLLYILWNVFVFSERHLHQPPPTTCFIWGNFQSPRPPPPSDRITRQK